MKKLLLLCMLFISSLGFNLASVAAPQLGQEFDAVAQTIPTDDSKKNRSHGNILVWMFTLLSYGTTPQCLA